MADISVEYLGLKLTSPVIAAPAGTTGSADLMQIAEESGIGAVVMRTLYAPGTDEATRQPHYELIRRNTGSMRSTTLYSSEHAALSDPQRYAEELRKCKQKCNIPIIASIGCLETDQWVEYAGIVEQAGADALEIHSHCPLGECVRGLTQVEEMAEIVSRVAVSVKIPVVVKMSPQLENPAEAAMAFEAAGARALVMFDRFMGLEIDIDQEQPVGGSGYAWHGGPWSIFYALRWISEASTRVQIPIAGCGGVGIWQDIVKYVLAGACVVQSASAIMTQGYHIVKDLNQGLAEWMDLKGYESLEDFRGKVSLGQTRVC